MVNKKKLAFFSLLFFIAFTIIGDAYIYYLDGKVFESDFKYTTDVKSEKLNREYIQDLDRLSKELNLKIYVVSSTVNSSNSATYTIYSTEEHKNYFKKRILVKNDHSIFKSLISGKREIIFKPFSDITEIKKEEYFYVFGTKKSVEKLRSETIDKYGMSKPEENRYQNDAIFMIISAWTFVFFIIFLYTMFEVNSLKKEVLIKYFNGSDKKSIIVPLMITNSVTIISSAFIGMLLAIFITESSKFLLISVLMLFVIVLSTNILYLMLRNLDIKKTFVRSYYTLGYKILAFFILFIITVTLILTLTFNLKTIYDAILTINQRDHWEEYYDYDNVLFLLKNYTETTNFETEREYAVKFYNDYLDKYRIHLSFDFSNNGGISSSMVNVNESIVYLNKYAKTEIKDLGIDLNKLKEDRYYLISRYTDAELKEKGIFDPSTPNEITNLLQNDDGIFETITIKNPYTLLIHDINMANLADNYKKNPIIIFDTHSKLPSNEMGFYVFNSLVKFNNDNDFEAFIKKIGYEDEIFYKNNIKDLYLEKRAEKILVLLINIILSIMLLILFNISLSTILKMDFNSRAIEIALHKVFGKTFFQRYKGVFRLLIGAFILGVGIALAGKIMFYHFSFLYIFFASTIVLINTIVILSLFINKFEQISISRVLKGGI
jgi:putative ABC transport system permease protein